jgi:hypothetical protein
MSAPERRPPLLPVLLAWLLPGGGHLAIGRLWPGVFVFAAVLPLYVGGMAMTGFQNVSWERHPIAFWAMHVFGGGITAAAALLTRHVEPLEAMPEKSVGELFTAVACLLNLIAISDVWARCDRGDPEAAAARREDDANSSVARAEDPPPDDAPAGPQPIEPPPPAAPEARGG